MRTLPLLSLSLALSGGVLAGAAEPGGQPPSGVKLGKRIEGGEVSPNAKWSRSPVPAARKPAQEAKAADVAIEAPVIAPQAGVLSSRTVIPPATPFESAPPRADAPAAEILPTGRPMGGLGRGLEMARFGERLRQADFSARLSLVDELEQHIGKTETALTALRGTESQMHGAGQKQFRVVSAAAEDRVNVLRRSLRTARTTTETAWPLTRAQLVADFETYADALSRFDAVLLGPGEASF
jgi:hypothetical protein